MKPGKAPGLDNIHSEVRNIMEGNNLELIERVVENIYKKVKIAKDSG